MLGYRTFIFRPSAVICVIVFVDVQSKLDGSGDLPITSYIKETLTFVNERDNCLIPTTADSDPT